MFAFFYFKPVAKEGQVTFLENSSNPGSFTAFSLDKNVKISLSCQNSINSVVVTDSEEKQFELSVVHKDNLYLVQPIKGGYQEGERYLLTVPNGCTVTMLEDKSVNSISFSIERKEVNDIQQKDNVVDKNEVLATFKTKNSVEIPADINVKPSDVLIIKDGKTLENRVIKVISEDKKDQITLIKYEDASIEDVFENINLFKKIKITEEDIFVDEDGIVQWMNENQFFDRFFTRTNAKLLPENVVFKVRVEKDGRIIISVEPKFTREDDSFFEIKLKLEIETKLNPTIDIRSLNDLRMHIDGDTKISMSISPDGEHSFADFESIPFDDFQKKYGSQKSEVIYNSKPLNLFSVKVPFHPLIEFYADFSVPMKLEGTLSLENYMTYKVNTSVGITCKAKCDFYSSAKASPSLEKLNFMGEVEAKFGLEVGSGVQLAHMTKLGGQLEFGIYVRGKGLIYMKNPLSLDMDGFFEVNAGIYRTADIVLKDESKFLNYDYRARAIKEEHSFMKLSNLEVLSGNNFSSKYYIRDNQLKLTPIQLKMYHLLDDTYHDVTVNSSDVKIYIGDTELVVKNNVAQLDSSLLNKKHKVDFVWLYNGKEIKDSFQTEFIESKIIEKPFSSLEASEIIWVTENIWSYKKGNRYGLITEANKVIDAMYTSHFHYFSDICSYRSGNYVGYTTRLDKEIECNGWGITEWGLLYDSSKKWTYYEDYGMYVRPENRYLDKYVALQRVVVGSGADKFFSFDGSIRDEFAIAEISKSSSDFSVKLLTNFDYTSVRYFRNNFAYPGANKPALFVVRGKNKKWGIVDSSGKQTVELIYDKFLDESKTSDNHSKTFFSVIKDGKHMIISGMGEVMYEAEKDEVLSEINGTKFWSQRNGKWFLMDLGI